MRLSALSYCFFQKKYTTFFVLNMVENPGMKWLMSTRRMGEQEFPWFSGTVESVDDPKMLGRVRVRFDSIHASPSISTSDLPWAYLLMPAVSACLSGIGISPTGIDVGSRVFGFCLDGYERQIPVVWGTYSKMPGGKPENNDVPALARETNTITKQQVGPEPPSAYAAKYPSNKVLVTKSGHAIEIDDTPGHERIHLYHKSGSYVEWNEKGRRVVKVVDDDFEIVVRDRTVFIKGDYTLEISGNYTVKVGGNYSVSSGGNATVSSGGNAVVHGGGNATLSSDGTTTISDPAGSISPPDTD
jgi:Gp5 N-terminal OB domain/Gp5 C-terminal repeat (3 copies)